MPRYGLATLNHSPLHGLPTRWEAHLDAAVAAGFDAIAPDVFWLRALDAEGVALPRLAEALEARGLACMEVAGLAIGDPEPTRIEADENLRYAAALGAEFVNTRFVSEIDAGAIEHLRVLASRFAEHGTRLALEFSRGTKLRGVAHGRELAEALAEHGVGVTLDTWHFCLSPEGPDWAALEALPLAALANVQLSDGVPYAEGRFVQATMHERRLPGRAASTSRAVRGSWAGRASTGRSSSRC